MRRLATITLVLAAVGMGFWLEREPLLRRAANLWIVSDAPAPADAVVVLGGQLQVRPVAAADLYRKGLVKKVLISQVAEDHLIGNGAIPGHTDSNRRVLLRLGVPEEAIEAFGKANRNTRDEALALREWAARHGA